ncbi:GNAT family N-acetyltransferase [Polaribacter sp.]|uniref:GNAT family N-acetyltransferase n=1 Tax=Polaribacter sp. TaxID=1920175 RepID=UPI0025D89A4E|nr:GNAT family N-acetyltransferase [Polaribacter sp.]
MIPDLEITPFKEEFSQRFYDLNAAWLKKYFYIEPYDEKVLSKPNTYIIAEGGFIFFAKYKNEIVGVVSLINQKSFFELSKMAVDPKFQGLKIGKELVKYCIAFAKQKKWVNIILYSHRSLETAIHLYKKMGFVEIPVEKNSHYKRANIKMILAF